MGFIVSTEESVAGWRMEMLMWHFENLFSTAFEIETETSRYLGRIWISWDYVCSPLFFMMSEMVANDNVSSSMMMM